MDSSEISGVSEDVALIFYAITEKSYLPVM